MRYNVLGPLTIVDGDRISSLNARKIETVLAVMLIRSDQVVSIERLMWEIWGSRPPRRATAGLYVYISQLRKFLHRSGSSDEGPILTRPPGYLLRLGSDELDANLFQRLIEQGRGHVRNGQHHAALESFDQAQALWRGPVLGDLRSSSIVDGFATQLTEARLDCIEMMVSCRLELGQHRELIGNLYSLITEHPLHEAFYRLLMTALYRSERKADALKVYQWARNTLNDELGLEPGPALQNLQRGILMDDELLVS